jgi:hypothetical protein
VLTTSIAPPRQLTRVSLVPVNSPTKRIDSTNWYLQAAILMIGHIKKLTRYMKTEFAGHMTIDIYKKKSKSSRRFTEIYKDLLDQMTTSGAKQTLFKKFKTKFKKLTENEFENIRHPLASKATLELLKIFRMVLNLSTKKKFEFWPPNPNEIGFEKAAEVVWQQHLDLSDSLVFELT